MDPRALRRFRKNKGAVFGAGLVVLVLSSAFAGPMVAPHDPNEQHADGLIRPDGLPVTSSDKFPLGTDPIGRDELSRLLHGGRVSMLVALGATLIAVFMGMLVGVLSGFIGGAVDTFSMRSVDILLSLPFLLIAIALNRVIDDPALWVLCMVLGLLSWTTLARVVRAKTMQTRELEYVQAARALGMNPVRIVLRHVVPNVMGPAIVLGTTLVAQMIIVESAMSYLGLGVQPPQASWGSMLYDGQQMMTYAPRLVVLPGLFIVATVFGFNLVGEGLRDAFDPKD